MTEEELIEFANEALEAINQPLLTAQEKANLWILYNQTEKSEANAYEAIGAIINSRGGEGDGIKKLRHYAALNGIFVGLDKKVFNNVYLGSVLW